MRNYICCQSTVLARLQAIGIVVGWSSLSVRLTFVRVCGSGKEHFVHSIWPS
ncbi:hypothetical protein BDV27DRAFT_126482 [Aspergillus caelatus]|uniref:Uncharacterized protein n=1 Tax=Aspergillus caelatus TaxID=61420 RepID=A0A5N7A991_9EURO|nr:uncharacterized protein BDV27DRAFT_126482 [Aspergillus caelatus]KAE8365696.1 hypothetical protein BDV27DRAFT_126482 [Aspergillus caelatus]